MSFTTLPCFLSTTDIIDKSTYLHIFVLLKSVIYSLKQLRMNIMHHPYRDRYHYLLHSIHRRVGFAYLGCALKWQNLNSIKERKKRNK